MFALSSATSLFALSSATLFLIAGAVIAVVIALGVVAHRIEMRRRAELAAWARRRGWSFAADRSTGLPRSYRQFELFRRGDDRYAWNVATGEFPIGDDRFDAVVADYHYEESSGSGKDRHTTSYDLSFALLRLPFAVPDLHIRREGFFDKVKAAFGFDDIDFESEEFSRRFHVQSPDKRFAYDVVSPAMMEFLLERDRPPAIELADGHLLLVDGRSRRWSVREIEAMLAFADAFFSRWPRHVLADVRR